MLSMQPSLSIHSRGYYDHGKGSNMVIQCANSLLQQGIIKRVFFSTDSEYLTSLASSSVVPPSALIMTNKTLTETKNSDGYSRDSSHRNEMDSAIKGALFSIGTYKIHLILIYVIHFCFSYRLGFGWQRRILHESNHGWLHIFSDSPCTWHL